MNESQITNSLLDYAPLWCGYFFGVWVFAYVTGRATRLLKSNNFAPQVVGHIFMAICYNMYSFLCLMSVYSSGRYDLVQTTAVATLAILIVTHAAMIRNRLRKRFAMQSMTRRS